MMSFGSLVAICAWKQLSNLHNANLHYNLGHSRSEAFLGLRLSDRPSKDPTTRIFIWQRAVA